MKNLRFLKSILAVASVCLIFSACKHMPFGKGDGNTKGEQHQSSIHQKSSKPGKASRTQQSSKIPNKEGALRTKLTPMEQPTLPISNTSPRQLASTKQSNVVIKKQKLNVAVLAPMSADKSGGRSMLDAAYLALEDLDFNHINLIQVDSGTDAQGIQRALIKLNSEDIDVIIGPMTKDAAEFVYSQYSSRRNTIVFALGGQDAISGYSSLYFLDFMPDQQATRILQYANSKGYGDLYSLLPNNNYGNNIYRNLQSNKSRMITLGSKIYDISSDTNSDLSFNKSVLDVKNVITKLYERQSSSNTNNQPLKLALMFPEGGKRLDYVAEQVKLAGADRIVQLKKLGSSLWRESEVKNLSDLEGSWVTDSPFGVRAAFEQRFQAKFGYVPSRASSMAYDAVALIVGISKQSDTDVEINSADLLNVNGFEGVNGVFRFTEDGFTQRLFAIYEIKGGKFVEIDAAPTEF